MRTPTCVNSITTFSDIEGDKKHIQVTVITAVFTNNIFPEGRTFDIVKDTKEDCLQAMRQWMAGLIPLICYGEYNYNDKDAVYIDYVLLGKELGPVSMLSNITIETFIKAEIE
jgi:hypothetical protein